MEVSIFSIHRSKMVKGRGQLIPVQSWPDGNQRLVQVLDAPPTIAPCPAASSTGKPSTESRVPTSGAACRGGGTVSGRR